MPKLHIIRDCEITPHPFGPTYVLTANTIREFLDHEIEALIAAGVAILTDHHRGADFTIPSGSIVRSTGFLDGLPFTAREIAPAEPYDFDPTITPPEAVASVCDGSYA